MPRSHILTQKDFIDNRIKFSIQIVWETSTVFPLFQLQKCNA